MNNCDICGKLVLIPGTYGINPFSVCHGHPNPILTDLTDKTPINIALLTHLADIYGLPIKEVLKNAKLFKEKE